MLPESGRDESMDRLLSSPAGAAPLSGIECQLWKLADGIPLSEGEGGAALCPCPSMESTARWG